MSWMASEPGFLVLLIPSRRFAWTDYLLLNLTLFFIKYLKLVHILLNITESIDMQITCALKK